MISMSKHRSIIMHYIILASGCAVLGMVITFLLLMALQYLDIDIMKNLWVLAIPVTLSLILNVLFLEMYRKYIRK